MSHFADPEYKNGCWDSCHHEEGQKLLMDSLHLEAEAIEGALACTRMFGKMAAAIKERDELDRALRWMEKKCETHRDDAIIDSDVGERLTTVLSDMRRDGEGLSLSQEQRIRGALGL